MFKISTNFELFFQNLKSTFIKISSLIQLVNSLKQLIEKTEQNASEIGMISKEKTGKEKKK